jgi:hypothetical protein
LQPLTEEQRRRVSESMFIATRATKAKAIKDNFRLRDEIFSAAAYGLMKAAESYDRLRIETPWEDWAVLGVDRALTDFFRSPFVRDMRRETQDESALTELVDPSGDHGFRMLDIEDLIEKVPDVRSALIAHMVVFGGESASSAAEKSGVCHYDNGGRAWNDAAAFFSQEVLA